MGRCVYVGVVVVVGEGGWWVCLELYALLPSAQKSRQCKGHKNSNEQHLNMDLDLELSDTKIHPRHI